MNIYTIYLTLHMLLSSCLSQIFKPFSSGALPFISKNTNLCNEQKQSALVEDFFNTVFTEFLMAQPACVCIQLCIGQSTFCYPNGCFHQIHFQKKDERMEALPQLTAPSFRITTTESYAHGDNNNVPPVHLKWYSSDRPKKVIIASSRPMLLRENPFKDRFQLLSFLTYKRPSFERYSEPENYPFDEFARPKKEDTNVNVGIDITKTQWPIAENYDKQTGINNGIRKKPPVIVKDTRKHIISPSFNVEDRIDSFEKQFNDESSQNVLTKRIKSTKLDQISQESFYGFDNVETPAPDDLKILPSTINKTKSTKIYTQQPSIAHKIGIASNKDEQSYGKNSTRKSYMSRRQPAFELRRMKNQIHRNRLGNELRAAHLRMETTKRGRMLHRGRSPYRRKRKGAMDLGAEKRTEKQSDLPITIVDVDVLTASFTESATDETTEPSFDCEQTTIMDEYDTNSGTISE